MQCNPVSLLQVSKGIGSSTCVLLQRVVVCCSVLQCVAVCCSVVQCGAVCGSVLQCNPVSLFCRVSKSIRSSTCVLLQYVAAHCSVLQYNTVSLFRRVSKDTGSSTCYYTRKSCEKVSSRENFKKQRTTILKYSALDTSPHHAHTYGFF